MGYSTKKIADVVVADGKDKITIKGDVLQKAALAVRAVNHPLRKKIIDLLNEKEDMVVSKIYRQLKIEQSVASQHLAILRRAGYVTTKRDGKFIHYTINADRFKNAAGLIEKLA